MTRTDAIDRLVEVTRLLEEAKMLTLDIASEYSLDGDNEEFKKELKEVFVKIKSAHTISQIYSIESNKN